MLKSRRHFPLKSGEFLVCREPRLISTVLGSCVAVTLFSGRLRMAGICHAMLPEPRRGHDADDRSGERFRYLTVVIPAMIEAFQRAGAASEQIEVKMFGGGNVIDVGGEEGAEEGVGAANIRMARHLLDKYQLALAASNVGGHRGRKIYFDTATGEVFHKFLSSTLQRNR